MIKSVFSSFRYRLFILVSTPLSSFIPVQVSLSFTTFVQVARHIPQFYLSNSFVVIHVLSILSSVAVLWFLERWSIECRETKVITPIYHNRRKQYNEPIRTQSKYMHVASVIRGKMHTSKACVTSAWLKKWCKFFLTNHRAQ